MQCQSGGMKTLVEVIGRYDKEGRKPVRIEPPQEASPASPEIEALSKLIAGKKAAHPDIIAQAIGKGRLIVNDNIKIESEKLGAEELRKQFNDVENAARLILEKLRDINCHHGFYVMLLEPDDKTPFQSEFEEALEALANRCEKKASDLTRKRMPVAAVDSTPDASVLCALIVRCLWKYARGKLPGVNSANAQEACALLWSLAGGHPRKRKPASESDDGAWRRSLEDAKKLEDAGDWRVGPILKYLGLPASR